MEVRHLLEPASRVAELLQETTRLELLSLDMSSADDRDRRLLREVVRGLDPALIDGHLADDDVWTQVSALASIAPIGSTAPRTALMLKHLAGALRHPALSAKLVPVLNQYWSGDVFRAVAAMVSELQSEPESAMFARDIVDACTERTTPEFARQVIEPLIPQAATETARRLLTLWRDVAVHTRAAVN